MPRFSQDLFNTLRINMKEKAQNNKKQILPVSADAYAFFAQITAKEKLTEKARAAYKLKTEAYEEALKQDVEKIALKRLLASAKIARHTYGIKKIELKLAKANWKAAKKAE